MFGEVMEIILTSRFGLFSATSDHALYPSTAALTQRCGLILTVSCDVDLFGVHTKCDQRIPNDLVASICL